MIIVFISLVIGIIGTVSCIRAERYLKEERKKETVRVLESHGAWIVGIIGLCFFGPLAFILALGFVYGKLGFLFVLIGWGFVWLCDYMIFGWLHEIIVYDKDGFWKGWYPRFRIYYTYQQIFSYDKEEYKLVMHLDEYGDKRIVLENRTKDLDSFMNFVRIRYEQITGMSLEKKFLKSKRDLYNGNLVNSGETTFVMLLMFALSFGITIFSLYEVLHERDESNTEYFELDLEYKEKNSDELVFEANGYKQEFVFDDWRSYDSNLLHCMLDSIMTDETLQIYAKYYSGGKYRSPFYSLCHVQDMNGNVFVTFQTGNESNKSVWLVCFWISLILFVINLLLDIRSITVARHPERYGPNPKFVIFEQSAIRWKENSVVEEVNLDDKKKVKEDRRKERVFAVVFVLSLWTILFAGISIKQRNSDGNNSIMIRDVEFSESIYVDAEYDLLRRGEPYRIMLTQGEYLVGTHLPEGYYTIEKVVGEGKFILEHPKYTIDNEYKWIQYDDIYWTIDAFPLYQGTKITVINAVYLSLSTHTGQTNRLRKLVENPSVSKEHISLEEGVYYIVGEDIPSGVYDFSIQEGKCYLRCGLSSEDKHDSIRTVYREIWLDKEKYESKYHNLYLDAGMVLYLDPNLEGECILRPSRKINLDGYDTYYELYR